MNKQEEISEEELKKEIEQRRFLGWDSKTRHSQGWCLTQGDVEELFEIVKRQTKQEFIERAKACNGMIKTEDDIINHIDRLERCSNCDVIFWDKVCPDCVGKRIDKKEKKNKFEKAVNE